MDEVRRPTDLEHGVQYMQEAIFIGCSGRGSGWISQSVVLRGLVRPLATESMESYVLVSPLAPYSNCDRPRLD
jgi:hypothetical protein